MLRCLKESVKLPKSYQCFRKSIKIWYNVRKDKGIPARRIGKLWKFKKLESDAMCGLKAGRDKGDWYGRYAIYRVMVFFM